MAADTCKNEIRKFWHAGHAIHGEIPSLETWHAWWNVRAFNWGSWFGTQEESGIFVPMTNLAEAKHASMCASVSFKIQTLLYEATGFDMSMAILQSVRCNAYLKGIHAGTGPKIQDMAERFSNQNTGRTSNKRIADLVHSSMDEMGIYSPEMQHCGVDKQSVCAKRLPLADPREILEEDSHRPNL